jgi:hypothetical protein
MKKTLTALVLFTFLTVALSYSLFKKVTLQSVDARCLDGTLGAYYVSEGDPSKVVISYEGGGWCGSSDLASTIEDCYQRSKGDLGSSKNYPDTFGQWDGILSDDPQNYFKNWTKVHMKYCDGTGHQGFKL